VNKKVEKITAIIDCLNFDKKLNFILLMIREKILFYPYKIIITIYSLVIIKYVRILGEGILKVDSYTRIDTIGN
jgi:hypothetical protein